MAFFTAFLLLSRLAFAQSPESAPLTTSAPEALGFPLETVALFLLVFAFSLVMDLFQHKEHKAVTWQNAAKWSVFWVATSLAFAGWITFHHGAEWGSLFLTGYVLEKTLSVDNLVVFIAVFRYFRIESGLQHRILYWGILGAIVFRAVFVVLGTGLLTVMGPWAEILFGGFVAWAGIQMLRANKDHDAEPHYDSMPLVGFFKRFFPLYPKLVGANFFVNRAEAERASVGDPTVALAPGVKRWMTPAFVCLLVIEGTDVLFAIDSVPAVIAISKEPLIVYTAMIFAVLGLRSLYFIVEAMTKYLVHLEKAVIGVLFFIAAKMFLSAAEHLTHVKIPWWSTLSSGTQANYSMFFVLGILGCGVLASLFWPGKDGDNKDGATAPGAH